MKDFIGTEFTGVITGVTPKGFAVELDDRPISTWIDPTQLPGGQRYVYQEESLSWRRRGGKESFRLGGTLTVEVTGSSISRGRIFARPLLEKQHEPEER